IYQGQEIGMLNAKLPTIYRYKEVSSVNTYQLFRKLGFTDKFTMKICQYASRDNARTPMQWSNAKNAGFTEADEPWFEVNPNYTEINVEQAEADENSILHYYRKLLKFRKENDIVKYGDFKLLKTAKKIFAYIRTYQGQKLLVINSFTDAELNFKISPDEFDLSKAELVLSNYDSCPVVHNGFVTKPYETRTYLIK
ncbi:MAG: hypothetical protein NC110_05875, partial [Ruminococcus sp.]|nr:hypothetical protein [Ruminococcus sp.]